MTRRHFLQTLIALFLGRFARRPSGGQSHQTFVPLVLKADTSTVWGNSVASARTWDTFTWG